MLPAEQVRKQLDRNAKGNPKLSQLPKLSPAGETLKALTIKGVHGLKRSRQDIYLDHFTLEENPWASPEGGLLAEQLFGTKKADFLADVWTLFAKLSYQTGYNRRPYRTTDGRLHLEHRLSMVQALFKGNREGFFQLDITETMQFAAYRKHAARGLAPLYAVALNREGTGGPLGELAWDILQGEDEIGGVHYALIQGLLMSEREDCWEMVEKTALAAQREEGLRQTIFETVDQAQLGAFLRFLALIRNNNLARFSSVVRAVGTWTGLAWEAAKKNTVDRALTIAQACLTDDAERRACLDSQDNLRIYLGLWSIAVREVDEAVIAAKDIVLKRERSAQLVALYFLTTTGRSHAELAAYAEEHFGEDLLRDYYLLFVLPVKYEWSRGLMDRILQQAGELPKEGKTFTGDLFSWHEVKVTSLALYNRVISRATADQLLQLAEKLADVPSEARETLLRRLLPKHYTWSLRYKTKQVPPIDPAAQPWVRGLMHQALTDRNGAAQATGVSLLESVPWNEEDEAVVVQLLKRKGKELRGNLIKLVAKQDYPTAQRVTSALLPAKSGDQRLAGLELLHQLAESERAAAYVATQVAAFRERPKLTKNEEILLQRFTPDEEKTAFSLANGFGAIDYDALRATIRPQLKFNGKKKGLLARLMGRENQFLFADFVDGKKITAALQKLLALVGRHGSHEYRIERGNDYTTTQLIQDGLSPRHPHLGMTAEERLADYPLPEVWREWHAEAGLNDFERYFLKAFLNGKGRGIGKTFYKELLGRYYPDCPEILEFTAKRHPNNFVSSLAALVNNFYRAHADGPMMHQFQMDVLEDILARWPAEARVNQVQKDKWGYERTTRWSSLAWLLFPGQDMAFTNPSMMSLVDADVALRFYDLTRYLYQAGHSDGSSVEDFHAVIDRSSSIQRHATFGNVGLYTPVCLYLYGKGKVGADELLTHGLHAPKVLKAMAAGEATDRGGGTVTINYPDGIADELVRNLLEVELERGDIATEATPYTNALQRIEGSGYLTRIAERMGKESLHRGYSYGSASSRKESFSGLLRKAYPAATDTSGAFAAEVESLKLPVKRWIEIAVYAPQWADWIGEALGIAELPSAVWWFHAHASDYANKEKAAIVARYSPVSMEDFRDGAVDIDWFHEAYGAVGKKHWKLLHEASKYISDGNGHRQVKLYSAIMLGEVKITETLARIKDKRDKVYVKGLGLVPLSRRSPRKDMLRRYELLQEFLRESKQFGNQRKESERKAVSIGLENLARTAGYGDPVRFGWVMEGRATQAILQDAVVESGDARVELVIDERGKADIIVERKGKRQKSIPSKLRKDKQILGLKESKAKLRKQYSRTLRSLEQAMIAGHTFTVAEIREINEHPVVRRLLDKLVLFHPGKSVEWFLAARRAERRRRPPPRTGRRGVTADRSPHPSLHDGAVGSLPALRFRQRVGTTIQADLPGTVHRHPERDGGEISVKPLPGPPDPAPKSSCPPHRPRVDGQLRRRPAKGRPRAGCLCLPLGAGGLVHALRRGSPGHRARRLHGPAHL